MRWIYEMKKAYHGGNNEVVIYPKDVEHKNADVDSNENGDQCACHEQSYDAGQTTLG
jgi:hypothetical protein